MPKDGSDSGCENSCVTLAVDTLSVNYLFNTDFAKLVDHMLNVRKCLFKREKMPTTTATEPTSDLSLSVDSLVLSVEDDPFEVRLAYNYALMSDEYYESLKRKDTLSKRHSLRERQLEAKAREMLRERESLVYVKRSAMLYNNTNTNTNANANNNIRTQLFQVRASRLRVDAFADERWHTRQQCYDILRRIDHAAPPPPPPPGYLHFIEHTHTFETQNALDSTKKNYTVVPQG